MNRNRDAMARAPAGTSVCVIPAGSYTIGSDSVPNAGPRHARQFAADVWLDRDLVTWRDYEAFVTGGGYADHAWWRTGDGPAFPAAARPTSVDGRCEAVRSATLAATIARPVASRRDLPVLGLSWFEAVAVCRFFGGRLPFETEWEVAVTERLVACGSAAPHQEWCLDVFARQYWRADVTIRGRPWNADGQVVVRGYAASEPVLGPSARRAADPAAAVASRGFRRAWDRPPGG